MSANHDHLIGSALDEFRVAEEHDAGPLGGPAAVRATVARRRMIRLTTLGVLGALVIGVPVGVFAANPWGNNGPPTDQDVAAALRCAVRQAVPANLDSDPAVEAAVLAECRPGQVLAFDRDRLGRVVPLGVVLSENAVALKERPAGGVTAIVAYSLLSTDPSNPPAQERAFAWDGTRFAQVDGPRAFVKVTADLAITGTPLQLAQDNTGKRGGLVTVIVKNNGPNEVEFFRVTFSAAHLVSISGNRHTHGALKPGESVSVTLNVTLQARSEEVLLLFTAAVHSFVDDANPADNTVELEVAQ